MEVGQHRGGAAELKSRVNEEIRFGGARIALDGTDGGGTDRDDPFGFIHGLDSLVWDDERFFVEMDVF